jgi:hypothetical protein
MSSASAGLARGLSRCRVARGVRWIRGRRVRSRLAARSCRRTAGGVVQPEDREEAFAWVDLNPVAGLASWSGRTEVDVGRALRVGLDRAGLASDVGLPLVGLQHPAGSAPKKITAGRSEEGAVHARGHRAEGRSPRAGVTLARGGVRCCVLGRVEFDAGERSCGLGADDRVELGSE